MRFGTQVLTIKNSDIAKHLSLPPVKLHCSMLAEDAIKAAVRDIKVCNVPCMQRRIVLFGLTIGMFCSQEYLSLHCRNIIASASRVLSTGPVLAPGRH